jgi:hypothetical protein
MIQKLQIGTVRPATLPRHKIGFYALIVVALAAASILTIS